MHGRQRERSCKDAALSTFRGSTQRALTAHSVLSQRRAPVRPEAVLTQRRLQEPPALAHNGAHALALCRAHRVARIPLLHSAVGASLGGIHTVPTSKCCTAPVTHKCATRPTSAAIPDAARRAPHTGAQSTCAPAPTTHHAICGCEQSGARPGRHYTLTAPCQRACAQGSYQPPSRLCKHAVTGRTQLRRCTLARERPGAPAAR
jgi:hypothetical protein